MAIDSTRLTSLVNAPDPRGGASASAASSAVSLVATSGDGPSFRELMNKEQSDSHARQHDTSSPSASSTSETKRRVKDTSRREHPSAELTPPNGALGAAVAVLIAGPATSLDTSGSPRRTQGLAHDHSLQDPISQVSAAHASRVSSPGSASPGEPGEPGAGRSVSPRSFVSADAPAHETSHQLVNTRALETQRGDSRVLESGSAPGRLAHERGTLTSASLPEQIASLVADARVTSSPMSTSDLDVSAVTASSVTPPKAGPHADHLDAADAALWAARGATDASSRLMSAERVSASLVPRMLAGEAKNNATSENHFALSGGSFEAVAARRTARLALDAPSSQGKLLPDDARTSTSPTSSATPPRWVVSDVAPVALDSAGVSSSSDRGGPHLDLSRFVGDVSRVIGPPGEYRLSLALHPEDLGTVHATVSLSGNELNVIIRPESAQGHGALARDIDALRSELSRGGLNVNVTLHDHATPHGQDDSARRHPVISVSDASEDAAASLSSVTSDSQIHVIL